MAKQIIKRPPNGFNKLLHRSVESASTKKRHALVILSTGLLEQAGNRCRVGLAAVTWLRRWTSSCVFTSATGPAACAHSATG
jgi:hypothetical protein